MITLMERLGVNVVSVVIGALFFLIAIAWVEALRNLVEYVFFHEEGIKDFHILQKKFLAAIFVTALSGFLIIIIYCIYKDTPTSKKVETPSREDDPGKNSFPGVTSLGEGRALTGGAGTDFLSDPILDTSVHVESNIETHE